MRRKALFIGVNKYSHGLTELSCAANDATELQEFFADCGYETHVLRNADTDGILSAIEEQTKDLQRSDVFLFFFAGHGYTVENPDQSLDRRLAGKADRYSRIMSGQDGIRLDEIRQSVSDAHCSCVIIMDACQSMVNPQRGGDTGREVCTARDLQAIANVLSRGDRQGNDNGFVVINSCQEGDVAYELSEERHGLFTLSFLDVVRQMRHNGENAAFDEGFTQKIAAQMAVHSRGRYKQRPICLPDSRSQNNIMIFPTVEEIGEDNPYAASSSTFVVCPVCGRHNLIIETFRCKVCGRDHLCLSHKSDRVGVCNDCAKVSEKSREASAALIKAGQEERYDAVWTYWPDADKNNPEVLYVVGMAYHFNGEHARALECLIKASSLGHVEAPYWIGELYNYGHGVHEDLVEAVHWFRLAAERGSLDGMFNLALKLEYGRDGVEKNLAEAIEWYRRAAEQGYYGAQYALGECYEEGKGVEKDPAEAIKWYRAAADQGDEDAKKALGRLRSQSIFSQIMRQSAVGDGSVGRNDPCPCGSGKKFKNCCGRRLQEGVPEESPKQAERPKTAWDVFASMMSQVSGCEVRVADADANQAVHAPVFWSETTSRKGGGPSACELFEQGEDYYRGQNGVQENRAKAFELYQKAADKGSADAQYSLGYMYAYGERLAGVPQDAEKALFWYRRAAAQGHEKAARFIERTERVAEAEKRQERSRRVQELMQSTAEGNYVEVELDNESCGYHGRTKGANRGRYFGPMVNGKPHGIGRFVSSSGDVYTGAFFYGVRSGKGKIEYQDGSTYEGGFLDGVWSGEGTYTWPDGTRHVGQFRNGVFDGQGRQIDPDGTSFTGTWNYGKFVAYT